MIRILIHSSFCELNFMWSACRTNFVVVAPTTPKVRMPAVKQTWKLEACLTATYKQYDLQNPQKK